MKRWMLIILYMSLFMITACNDPNRHPDTKPNDDISRTIYEVVREDEIYYIEKETISNGITRYDFLIYKEREGQLLKLIKAANDAIREQETEEKILIVCNLYLPGGWGPVMTLRNYSDEKDTKAKYQDLQISEIMGKSIKNNSIYNLPETYRDLPGIKHLIVSEDMADITERDNVDWNEYFPELESLEIISKEE